jgi:hypothetical protein
VQQGSSTCGVQGHVLWTEVTQVLSPLRAVQPTIQMQGSNAGASLHKVVAHSLQAGAGDHAVCRKGGIVLWS